MTNECITNDRHVISLRLKQLDFQSAEYIGNRQIQLCVRETTPRNNTLLVFTL